MPTFRRCSITYREKDRPFLSICDSIKENKLRENDHYLQLQRERQAFSESLWLTAWDVSKSKRTNSEKMIITYSYRERRTNSEKMIITYSYREKDRPFRSLCDSLHEISQSQREQTQRKRPLLTDRKLKRRMLAMPRAFSCRITGARSLRCISGTVAAGNVSNDSSVK